MESGETGLVDRLMGIAKEHGLDLEGEFHNILSRVFPTPAVGVLPTAADEVITLIGAAEDCGIKGSAELFWAILDRVYPPHYKCDCGRAIGRNDPFHPNSGEQVSLDALLTRI